MTDDERIVTEEIAQSLVGVLRDHEATLPVELVALRVLPHLAGYVYRTTVNRVAVETVVSDTFDLAEAFVRERDKRGLLQVEATP